MAGKIIAKDNGGGADFEVPEAGNYLARCFQMVEVGHILAFKDDKKKTHKVILGFELPTLMAEFKAGEGEKPYYVNKEMTLSLNKKASMRKFLEDWRGKPLTEEEASEFELTVLVGAPCWLNIKHRQGKGDKADRTYLDIAGIAPLKKSERATMPAQVNKSQVLAYDAFDWNLLGTLPNYIQDKIKSADEYNAMVGAGKAPGLVTGKGVNANKPDLIPMPEPVGIGADTDEDPPF